MTLSAHIESRAAGKQVRMGADPTDSMAGLHINQSSNITSLPSPPFSAKATEQDSDRTTDGSFVGEVAGGGSSVSASGGAKGGTMKAATLVQVQADRQNS